MHSSNKLGSNRRKVIAVHGNGVMAGKWVSEIAHAQSIFDNSERSFDSLGASMRGSLTVYILDPESRQVVILCDPFGSSIVYIYESSHLFAASSDLSSLRDGIEKFGIRLEKNLQYAALYVASNTGGLSQSSYKNVRSLQPHKYLTMNANTLTENKYSQWVDISFPELSYDELLEKAALEIVGNIEAALTHDTQIRISQLTGGLDSRLVLAALLASGHAGKFSFYCAGNVKEPDKVVARQLSTQFDLNMTEYSGLRSIRHADSFEELLSSPFEETSGIISGPAHPLLEYGNDLVLSGGYGEFLRSAFDKGQLFDGNYSSALERLFGKASFSSFPTRRLVSQSVYQHALDSLKCLVDEGESAGIPKESALDGAYIIGRNRYFVGETSRSLSPYVARFDPLYSPYILALGLRGNLEEKYSNVPMFDLMNQFEPDLMLLPFDSDRIKPSYESMRGKVSRNTFLHDSSVNPSFTEYPKRRSINGIQASFFGSPSSDDITLAKQLHTAPRLVAQNSDVQLRLRELVSDSNMTKISEYFNPLMIRLTIERKPTHRVHLRQSSNLYAALLWFLK